MKTNAELIAAVRAVHRPFGERFDDTCLGCGEWHPCERALLANRLEQAERELADIRERVGPDYHVVDVNAGGWGIQHPLACRPDLTACTVHMAAVRQWEGPPAPIGRYRLYMLDGGYLSTEPLAASRESGAFSPAPSAGGGVAASPHGEQDGAR